MLASQNAFKVLGAEPMVYVYFVSLLISVKGLGML